MPKSNLVLAHVADLLFAARLRDAAAATGAELLLARKSGEWVDQARARKPRLLILDLDTRVLDPIALITETKADDELRSIPLLAYVSHIREDASAAAQLAGADRVLARGAFAKNLQQIMAG
jgi:CheY-like chemotaxis protein